MKRKTVTNIIFIICCLSTYAQDSIFTAKAYYSAPSEITVEVENLDDKEMVILIAGKRSYINLYKKAGDYKTEKLVDHQLKATDSLRILSKIPQNKILVSKYKVKDRALSKVFLQMKYTHYFDSLLAKNKWKDYSKEMDILPYDSLRQELDKNRIVHKKEKLSGDYVYNNPEVMPEFPGGSSQMIRFLYNATSSYYDINLSMRVRVIIEKDGSITHPYLIIGDYFLQKVTFEIIERMPKWKPGLHKGKPVRTFYIISVPFRLQ